MLTVFMVIPELNCERNIILIVTKFGIRNLEYIEIRVRGASTDFGFVDNQPIFGSIAVLLEFVETEKRRNRA